MTAPWIDPMQQYPPGLLAPAPPVLPPVPYAPKPSIVDRVAARLFPTGAYRGLLDSGAQQQLGQQGLQRLSANLLQAGGASPYQRGTLANIGAALGASQMSFPEMAQQALQLQAYRAQQAEAGAIAAVGKNHPIMPGMSRDAIYQNQLAILNDLMTIPGGAAIAEKWAPVIAATKPDKAGEPQHLTGVVDTRLKSPTLGQVGDFIIPYPGAPRDEWTFVKGKPDTTNQAAKPTPQQGQQAEFGAAAISAWQQIEKARTDDPNVETEVGQIMASPAFAKAVPFFHNAGDAVQALQKAGASAGAQRYMRAKWAFLDNIIRTRIPGGRMSGQYLSQVAQEMMPSLDVEGNMQMRANELQSILTAQGESGYDLNPSLWNNAVRRHGVAGVDLQALLSGQSGDARMNQIRARY